MKDKTSVLDSVLDVEIKQTAENGMGYRPTRNIDEISDRMFYLPDKLTTKQCAINAGYFND